MVWYLLIDTLGFVWSFLIAMGTDSGLVNVSQSSMVDAKNQLICPIILRQTISYARMWKSGSTAEPKITLNKHKASSPCGVSARYSGSKEDGPPQAIRPVQPSSWSFSIRSGLCQSSQPWGSLFCGRAPPQSSRMGMLSSGQVFPETSYWKGSMCNSKCERPLGLALHTDCDSYCSGGWEHLCKSEKTLLPREKKAHKIFSY